MIINKLLIARIALLFYYFAYNQGCTIYYVQNDTSTALVRVSRTSFPDYACTHCIPRTSTTAGDSPKFLFASDYENLN